MASRVGILGGTGYTALELVKILLRLPHVEVTVMTSRQDPQHVCQAHPELTGRLDLELEPFALQALLDRTDLVFSCLPHAASAEAVVQLADAGVGVVDLSADYRLTDVGVYEHWYGAKHPDPDRLGEVPYGLPELYREEIRGAMLVANPGCYPTSAILALVPLIESGLVSPEGIVVDSKSGVSGAGRTPKMATLYPECNESIAAYGVGAHRHAPEISQQLTRAAGSAVEVVFTPHLVPMNRGILTTAYADVAGDFSQQDLIDALRDYYHEEPFVTVVDELPATRHVSGTNAVHLTARRAGGKAIVVCCLDNLIKGAAGAAVQNMNLMLGVNETLGLLDRCDV